MFLCRTIRSGSNENLLIATDNKTINNLFIYNQKQTDEQCISELRRSIEIGFCMTQNDCPNLFICCINVLAIRGKTAFHTWITPSPPSSNTQLWCVIKVVDDYL